MLSLAQSWMTMQSWIYWSHRHLHIQKLWGNIWTGLKGDVLISSQVDFEAAAQSVMMETLREVKRLRPKALWGVSPYPSCYNGDADQTVLANYTGQCPAAEMALNDELLWLWKRCSALYPLLTLEKLQVGHTTLLSLCVSFHVFVFKVETFYNRNNQKKEHRKPVHSSKEKHLLSHVSPKVFCYTGSLGWGCIKAYVRISTSTWLDISRSSTVGRRGWVTESCEN